MCQPCLHFSNSMVSTLATYLPTHCIPNLGKVGGPPKPLPELLSFARQLLNCLYKILISLHQGLIVAWKFDIFPSALSLSIHNDFFNLLDTSLISQFQILPLLPSCLSRQFSRHYLDSGVRAILCSSHSTFARRAAPGLLLFT